MDRVEYVVRINAGQKVQPKTISIRGGADMFDRYKMRQLLVQVVGKGKMITTRLVNVDNVAKDLKTEPAYIGAYFGYELGAQAKYEAKKPEAERASISGEHDASQLSNQLRSFIREVVVCAGCGLPEITLRLDAKTQDVHAKCSSCGHQYALKLNNAKFAKFMVSHPPSAVNTKAIKAAEAKQEKAEKGVAAATPAPAAGAPAAGATPAPAATNGDAAGKKPKKPSSKKPAAKPDEDDDVAWSVSTDAEAVKKRALELLPSAAVASLVQGAPDNAASAIPGNVVAATDALRAVAARTPPPSAADWAAELKAVTAAQSLDAKGAAQAVFDALFTASNVALKDKVKSHAEQLQPVLANPEGQQAVLTRLEALVHERPELVKKLMAILKSFYDLELIEEEAILAWHAAPAADEVGAAVRKDTKALVDWLSTADDDDEEDEEDEEDNA